VNTIGVASERDVEPAVHEESGARCGADAAQGASELQKRGTLEILFAQADRDRDAAVRAAKWRRADERARDDLGEGPAGRTLAVGDEVKGGCLQSQISPAPPAAAAIR
jgi:hypothetical protein